MKTRRYEVQITGMSPLLLHHDNLDWAEVLKKWAADPANKKGSVAGDDRSPAHRWIGNLYVEGGKIVMPADNLMTMLREGGAKCPTGKGQTTFKRQTQSGLLVDQSAWPILVGGKPVPYAPFKTLIDEPDFDRHQQVAIEHGFELFVKRAKIGQSKHVRVRPRFDNWTVAGSITVMDDMITTDVLQNILTFAGQYAGLGDWRASAPKSPGPFGRFEATCREMK